LRRICPRRSSGAEGDVEADEVALLDECPHPRVGEPQVLPGDCRVGVPDAADVEEMVLNFVANEVYCFPIIVQYL
jgi:hypothetical protein